MTNQAILEGTRKWIETMVIGLNLCPFAKRVFEGNAIKYVVTDVVEPGALLRVLGEEIQSLAAIPSLETTLIIHPFALNDFLDFNDFLAVANQWNADIGFEGVVQIASFHPDYQFAGTDPTDVENYTNRSPYPMLHLLREESISRAAEEYGDLLGIPKKNIETLKALGLESVLKRLLPSQSLRTE